MKNVRVLFINSFIFYFSLKENRTVISNFYILRFWSVYM